MDWLVYVLPQRYLIHVCSQAKARNAIVGGLDEGNHIVRISDRVVVKYGYGVSSGEAATQGYAYRHLDQRRIRVPRVYRFFQDWSDPSWPKGHLVMEYIPGKTLEEDCGVNVDGAGVARRLASVVSQLAAVKSSDVPGQVHVGSGGMLQGYLWGDNGTREVFHFVDDMNRWLNKRLRLIDKLIDLRPYPLALCHLGLCRRNVKITEDGTVALLD